MSSMKKLVALCASGVVALLVLVGAGCGGSSMSHTMTPAQAQAVSQEFATAVAAAMQSAATNIPVSSTEHRSLAAAIKDIHPDTTMPDCTSTPTSEMCNIPVSANAACPGGGTIGVTGNFDFTLSNGSGSDSAMLTVTPTNCSVDNLTINGNPNVTVSTQLNFQKDAIVFPVSLMETGGITFGPNPSGSCSVNVTATINSLSSCTITGTVCGQSVSGSC
jgi:hypothetical protein